MESRFSKSDMENARKEIFAGDWDSPQSGDYMKSPEVSRNVQAAIEHLGKQYGIWVERDMGFTMNISRDDYSKHGIAQALSH